MRLWHIDLLTKLPQKQLCGQWRECAAMLGNGWGKKHSTVDYAYTYPEEYLVIFSLYVYAEMIRRGYHPNKLVITNALLKRHTKEEAISIYKKAENLMQTTSKYFYKEHNQEYLQVCLDNLANKNIFLD